MSVNLVQALAQSEGIQLLPKINPNTQDARISPDLLLQAVIPSVLVGFYKFTKDEKMAATICGSGSLVNWEDILFADQKKQLVGKIAAYSGSSEEMTKRCIAATIQKCISLFCEHTKSLPSSGIEINKMLTDQRNNILQHLPAAIEIGKILNDTTLDDSTNKMDGPVSGLMHSIEKSFSGSEPKKND